MKQLTVAEAIKATSPNPFAALVTKSAEGKINIMGLSWYTMVSIRDQKLLFCLSKKGYSGKLLQETKKATLCLMTESAAEEIMACCRMSGADHDKISEMGIEMHLYEGLDTEVPKGAGVCFSLMLDETVDRCDHVIYLCSIQKAVQLEAGPYLYALDGYKEIKTL